MGCAALGHPKQCPSIPVAVPAGVTSASTPGRNHADEAADGTGGDGPLRCGIAGFVGSVGRRAWSAGGCGRAKRRDNPGTHVGRQVGPRRHEAGQVGVGRGVAAPRRRLRRGRDCAPFGSTRSPRCDWRCAPIGIGVFSRRFRECSGVRLPPAPFLPTAVLARGATPRDPERGSARPPAQIITLRLYTHHSNITIASAPSSSQGQSLRVSSTSFCV